jgi:3'-5' exonuclease
MQIPNPEQLILIDIETVSQKSDFSELSQEWQALWEEKVAWQLTEETTAPEFYQKRAAILAEFGKIICISVGYFKAEQGAIQLRIKSFSNHDEKELLLDFVQAVQQLQQARKIRMWFAGHNIREFDIPYLCRRLIVNTMAPPAWLDFQATKPWDVPLLDTLQLWKFGDYKHFTSLNLLAACLGIVSPKDDINGSQVGEVYWKLNDLPRIVEYCQKDVVTVAQLILRFSNQPLLHPDQVVIT